MIAVLCTRKHSSFDALAGADCYDVARGARSWRGGAQVVAMPPCKQWSRLRHNARDIPAERVLGVWCADMVREWGGVLEQPACSTLFDAALLPRPGGSDHRGFTISVLQFWWGHRATKATWLYIAGLDSRAGLPEIPLVIGEPTHTVGQSARGLKELSKTGAEATPPRFAAWLLEVARRCRAS